MRRTKKVKTHAGPKGPGPPSDDESETDEPETDPDVPEEEPEPEVPEHVDPDRDVPEEVKEHRDAYADGEDETWFYVHHFGGEWTMDFKGVAVDRVGTLARAGVARAWCLAHDWPRQKSYTYAKFGIEEANMLAREVRRRASFFFRVWFLADGDFNYEKEHLDAYEESYEWIAWMAAQPVDSTAFEAGLSVRRMYPSNVDDDSSSSISEDDVLVDAG